MSASEDKLKIPIEIKTDDLDEIRELINEISQAQADLQNIKATPRKGRGTGDTTSKSAFTSPEPRDGGIFGGNEGDALPTQGRDKKSKTPYQRENEFAKLQNQVQDVQQKQDAFDSIQQGLGGATQGIGFAQLVAGPNPGTKGLGAIANVAGRAFLPLAIVTTVISIVKGILDQALAPGGPLDRRFRRQIDEEIVNATSLEKKQQTNQGFRVVRTQLYPSLRGVGTSSNVRDERPAAIYDIGLASGMAGVV